MSLLEWVGWGWGGLHICACMSLLEWVGWGWGGLHICACMSLLEWVGWGWGVTYLCMHESAGVGGVGVGGYISVHA